MTTTTTREILVLKRVPGYLRLHVPPLLYAGVLASRVEAQLRALRGVQRVVVDRQRARLAVFYDEALTGDLPLLRVVDEQATPLLTRMEPERFAEQLVVQRTARAQRLRGKVVQGGYVASLVWVHAWVLRSMVRSPVATWWIWALVGFAVWTHRRQIKSIPQLSS